MVDRYQVSDRSGAAITNAVLKDVRYLSELKSTQYTKKKSKTLKEVREKEDGLFSEVDG